jgi:hypothetical protein
MKAGVIGQLDSPIPFEPSLSNTAQINHDTFSELRQRIETIQEIRLEDGKSVYTGRAAMEDIVSSEEAQILEDSISVREKSNKVTKFTNFALLPDEVVIVSSGRGRFVFELLTEHTDCVVTRSKINLNSFIESHPEANPWKVGFYENIGDAENGVVHGNKLLSGTEISNILKKSKKNQLGAEHSFNSELIKMFAAEGGYVEIYQPSEFETAEFVEYVDSEIASHLEPV